MNHHDTLPKFLLPILYGVQTEQKLHLDTQLSLSLCWPLISNISQVTGLLLLLRESCFATEQMDCALEFCGSFESFNALGGTGEEVEIKLRSWSKGSTSIFLLQRSSYFQACVPSIYSKNTCGSLRIFLFCRWVTRLTKFLSPLFLQ